MNFQLVDGDIVIGRGAVRVEGAQYVAQLVSNRLKTILGEWELNRSVGLPWFTEILTHTYEEGTILNWVSRTIVETEGVESLDDIELMINKSERTLSVRFTASTTFGGVSQVVNI